MTKPTTMKLRAFLLILSVTGWMIACSGNSGPTTSIDPDTPKTEIGNPPNDMLHGTFESNGITITLFGAGGDGMVPFEVSGSCELEGKAKVSGNVATFTSGDAVIVFTHNGNSLEVKTTGKPSCVINGTFPKVQ